MKTITTFGLNIAIALSFGLSIVGCGGSAGETDDGTPTAPVVTVPAFFAEATTYTLTQEVTSLISELTGNLEDAYKISITDPGTYTTYVQLLTGTTDSPYEETRLKVYDAVGTVILDMYDYANLDAANEWKRATFEALTAGDYYIQINREDNIAVNYSFSVYPSVANGLIQNDDNELNDEKSMATPITLAEASTDVNGTLNITDITDSDDWYVLPLTATGTYTTYIELLTGTTDSPYEETRVRVYDEIGTVLLDIYDYANLDAANEWKRATFEALAAGNYYIQINREGNLAAKYSLSVHPSVANGLIQNDDNELNDEKSMATPITLAEASADINGSVNITDITDSDDWYVLPLTATGTYTTYVQLLAGTINSPYEETRLRVYDEVGTVLLDMYDYANLDAETEWKRATFEAFTAGNYYIQINREGNLAAKYSLSVHPSVANGLIQNDDNELNDEKSMATPITLAEASADINGSVNITDITDSDDWYKLPLTTTGIYTTYVQLLAGTINSPYEETRLRVYDEVGTVLLDMYQYANLDAADENLTQTFIVNSNGNYYIQVYREDNIATKYTLNISKQ